MIYLLEQCILLDAEMSGLPSGIQEESHTTDRGMVQ
jgi:hypothetical protein